MKSKNGRLTAVAVALTVAKVMTGAPLAAHASIIHVTGAARVYQAPRSVALNAWESNRYSRVFQENSNLVLDHDLQVDITLAGTYKRGADMTHGLIEEGTAVDTFLIHQDGKKSKKRLTLKGSIRFDEVILGVILGRNRLNATDAALGTSHTIYPSLTHIARGLELNPKRDWIRISADRRTITFRMHSGNSMDEFRVLTANSASIPGPGSAALLAVAALIAAPRRRRLALQD